MLISFLILLLIVIVSVMLILMFVRECEVDCVLVVICVKWVFVCFGEKDVLSYLFVVVLVYFSDFGLSVVR